MLAGQRRLVTVAAARTLGLRCGTGVLATAGAALCEPRRFVGPRQFAPKGLREAAGRMPMTPEFAEECFALGKAAHQSKNYGDAVSLLDRALSTRREIDGPLNPRCAEVLYELGRTFLDMKEYGAAENALTEASAIYEKSGDDIKYAESLELLALAYSHLKFLEEAEKAFKDSIRVFRDRCYNHAANSWIPDDPTPPPQPQKSPLASAAHALADCAALFIQRDMQHQAIVFLEEALQIRRYLYSRHIKYRPIIAQTLVKLCELKKSVNDGTGAEMAISESLEICIETMGRDHPATAQAMSSKAGLLVARKQFREALRLYQDSATTYALTLGNDSPLYAQELIKLARTAELCNEYEQATKAYERGIDLIGKAFGSDSVQLAEAKTFHGQLLVKQFELARALEYFREAVRIRKAKDRTDPQLPYLYQRIGDVYAMQRETHAEAYFLMAIEGFRANAKVEPLQNTYATDVLDDLGLFYMDYQHYDKAEKCFKESLDTRISTLGENHAVVAYSYSNFALLYLFEEKIDESIKMCESALDMYAKTARSNVLAQADVHTILGQCYHKKKDYAAALKWLEKALNTRRTRGESTETGVAECLNHIARVYVSMEKYGKASRYVEEARQLVSQYNIDLIKRFLEEIEKTAKQIPPKDKWTEEDQRDYLAGAKQLSSS